MSKITPCLWFDGEAEEAANFYVSLLPDSKIEVVQKNMTNGRSGKAGIGLKFKFYLRIVHQLGQRCQQNIDGVAGEQANI